MSSAPLSLECPRFRPPAGSWRVRAGSRLEFGMHGLGGAAWPGWRLVVALGMPLSPSGDMGWGPTVTELCVLSRWIQPLWIWGFRILGNGAVEELHGWRLVVDLGMSQLSLSPPGSTGWGPGVTLTCAPFLDGSSLSGFGIWWILRNRGRKLQVHGCWRLVTHCGGSGGTAAGRGHVPPVAPLR